MQVKGDIVECGVFKGASLIRLATFRDLIEDSQKRKILGFDSFGKFPMPKINIKTDMISFNIMRFVGKSSYLYRYVHIEDISLCAS